jgi:hypothetical protein
MQKRTLARGPCALDAGAREVRLDRSVSSNLWPEPTLVHGASRLAPLSGEFVDLDTRAKLESPVAITAHSAGRWPVEGFTREENLRLVEGYEREHAAGEAFTYALLSPGRDQEWGCVYLRPLQFFLDPAETEILDALTEAGLSQVNATHQELPYLWFVRR